MDATPNREGSTPHGWMKLVTGLVLVLQCVFGFITPTIDSPSWVPFIRAMLALGLLFGAVIVFAIVVHP